MHTVGVYLRAADREPGCVQGMVGGKSQNSEIDDLEEPVSGRVVNPRIVVWASDACLQIDGLSWQFLARQFA